MPESSAVDLLTHLTEVLIGRFGVIVHALKTWPGPFADVSQGLKRHEIRLDDRYYATGQVVILREWLPATQVYTGQYSVFQIGTVTRGGEWSLPFGLCVFTLLPLDLEGLVP